MPLSKYFTRELQQKDDRDILSCKVRESPYVDTLVAARFVPHQEQPIKCINKTYQAQQQQSDL